VTRMVLSDERDRPFKTPEDTAVKPNVAAFPDAPREILEQRVEGLLEQLALMQLSGTGRRKRRFHHGRQVMGLGVAPLIACGLAGLTPTTALAQSASTWDKRGQQAEARDDFDAAFEAFRQAHLKKPKDLRYHERYERLRFEAANMHVDRGRVLRQSGDIDGAINEFARSLQIDPGNQAAAQELQITEQRSKAGPTAATPGAAGLPGSGIGPGKVLVPGLQEQTPYQTRVQEDIASMGAPITLQPVSNDPITLHMVEDAKVVYQAVGKAAGLNVIFDPDYTSKRVQVDLNGVSLPDALRILGVLSGTFWKPVTGNTIFVAQNNRTKRRNLLDPSVKLYLVASQNAIVMRATTDELILAEKLINDLDRAKPEVVIDVAVLEVSRQKERDLGITLPTSFGLTPQASNANSTSSSTTTSTTTSGITLNTLGNLNATNFAVSVGGGTVNALLSDSDTRILQNPRIRATDGQEATLKIGSKIPVATGSYSAGAAVTTASLGVQTQFTYLDVGVNIDITPTVHYDRQVSLKLKVEVSAQNGSSTISGVTEPIISQRVAQQVIELKDGEPSILAGLVQQQDTKNVSGTPGLGELPFFKYFFASNDKIQQRDEIVFLLIPHIVRESVLTDENTRAVYSGTSQSVELRRKDPSKMVADAVAPGADVAGMSPNLQPSSAARAASSMMEKMAADAKPLTPEGMGAANTGAMNGTGTAPVTLMVLPASANQAVGSTFQVSVMAANAHDLSSVPMQMQFDPRVLQLVNVDAGDFLAHDLQPVALVHRDEGNGAVTISAARPPGAKGVDGQGIVCTLTFKAIAPGDATLALTRIGTKDSKQNSIPAVGMQSVVHVK
jgi:general secretion pathway protein D